jgi:hypothetical protein
LGIGVEDKLFFEITDFFYKLDMIFAFSVRIR